MGLFVTFHCLGDTGHLGGHGAGDQLRVQPCVTSTRFAKLLVTVVSGVMIFPNASAVVPLVMLVVMRRCFMLCHI